MNQNEIPEMGPQGRYWDQPPTDAIRLDDESATMSQESFDQLKEYDEHSPPKGIYEGKMWKSEVAGVWQLCWYGFHEDHSQCSLNSRIINIVD